MVDDRRSGATVDKAVIDTSIASPGILIDDRRLTAACRVARKPLLVHCSPFLQFGGFGRYYFQVVIDSIDAEFGGNIAVGIDVQKSEEAVLEALVPGFVGNDKGVFGCSMQVVALCSVAGVVVTCDARRRTTASYTDKARAKCAQQPSSRCVTATACLQRVLVSLWRRFDAGAETCGLQGDVVGVAVDVQLGCLSFYVNNVPVVRDSEADVAAKKGKGKFASAYVISSPGTTRFRPAVFVYSPRASKLSQVRVCGGWGWCMYAADVLVHYYHYGLFMLTVVAGHVRLHNVGRRACAAARPHIALCLKAPRYRPCCM